jgi:hypothetical protein
MGGFCGAIHLDICNMLHKVPIFDPFYDNYHLISHTWGWCAECELVYRSQQFLVDLLVFHLVLVFLYHFAIYVNGFI